MGLPLPSSASVTDATAMSTGPQRTGAVWLDIGGINSSSGQKALAWAIVAAAALIAWVLTRRGRG